MPVLNNVHVWKESLLIVLTLFLPLLCSFLFSVDIIKTLSINATRNLFLDIIVIYLITVLLNGVVPFKNAKTNIIAAGITPLIWTLSFSIVFSVLHNYSSIVNYIGAVLLFLLCYAVNSFSIVDFKINKYTLYIVKTFYSILLFLLGLPALFYLAYVKLYGKGINDIVVLTVLQTNCSEVKSYLLNTFSIAQLVIIGASLILLLAIIIFSVNQLTTPEKWKANFINRKIKCYYSSIVILIIVISGFLLYRHHFYIFPFDRYYSINASDSGLLKIFNDFNKNINKNAAQIQVSALKDTTQDGTIILVIGESANRTYMSAFNTGMTENTTPWQKQMRDTSDFVFFDNAYSNYPLTVMALSLAFTNSNQYNNIPLDKAVSIIDVAKKAGFYTHYYSMQQRGTLYDAGVSAIANQADQVEYVCEYYYGYDEQILPTLKKISPSKKNFVVLHLRGSHFIYSARYPVNFAEENSQLFSKPNREYKFSLLYNDQILKRIYQYAEENLNLKAMIYFSDHGEDMKYTHLANNFTFSMVHIPFWVYLSPKMDYNHSELLVNLKRNKKAIFTNDLLFDTIHGLLQCKSNYYDSSFDLSHPDYNLPLTKAKTMHGTVSVMDDPVWNN